MNIPDNLSAIVRLIKIDWQNMYFGARPYVEAMGRLNTLEDIYGCDSAQSIVRYFLGNAKTWRGDTARAVKQKLHELLHEGAVKPHS
jgi:hypothetical protein